MNKKLAALVVCACLSPLVQAQQPPVDVLRVDFSVNVTRMLDTFTGTYRDITPITGIGTVNFVTAIPETFIDGQNTRGFVGAEFAPWFTSPVPGSQPQSSAAYIDFFADTRNSSASFVQTADLHFYSPGVGPGWDFQLTASRTSAPRTDSPAEQAFTSDSLVSFYQDLAASGAPLHYMERGTANLYDDPGFLLGPGLQIDDTSARIVGLQLNGVTLPVPEPSTWALMGLGLLGLGVAAGRRPGRRLTTAAAPAAPIAAPA